MTMEFCEVCDNMLYLSKRDDEIDLVHVCKKCGLIASYNDQMNIHLCRNCDNRTDFAYVEIPYACKLLFQELTTMNISPRIIT